MNDVWLMWGCVNLAMALIFGLTSRNLYVTLPNVVFAVVCFTIATM